MKQATFQIWRSPHGKEGQFQDYTVGIHDGMVVLDAIMEIQQSQANDLAVRWNCKSGKCGSCSAEINGIPRLMCMTRLSQLPQDKPIIVEPLKTFPNIKDLVTDLSWNYQVKQSIHKFTLKNENYLSNHPIMHQVDINRIQEFRKCIECFLCQDVCHVLREHKLFDKFIGPRFLMYTANQQMHPLDEKNRLLDLKDKYGIGYCNITKCCTKVCPEGIRITDNAIIPLKERVVDQFYDPLFILIQKLKSWLKKKPNKEISLTKD